MKKQITLGFFILLGLVSIGYLTIKLGRMDFLNSSVHAYHARFTTVAGLRSGANVEVAGVKIGNVGSIYLDKDTNMAIIDLFVSKDIPLPEDTIASIKTTGLIGDKYISLSLGGSTSTLKPGSTIIDTEAPTDLEALLGKYVLGGI